MGSSPAIPARASEESCSIPRLLSSFPNRTHCIGLRFGRRGSPFLFGSETIRSLLRRFAPVAQEVEHLPFKQGVRGSSPRWSTKPTKSEPDLPYGRRVRILCFLPQSVLLQRCTPPSRIQAERAEKEEIKMIWRY